MRSCCIMEFSQQQKACHQFFHSCVSHSLCVCVSVSAWAWSGVMLWLYDLNWDIHWEQIGYTWQLSHTIIYLFKLVWPWHRSQKLRHTKTQRHYQWALIKSTLYATCTTTILSKAHTMLYNLNMYLIQQKYRNKLMQSFWKPIKLSRQPSELEKTACPRLLQRQCIENPRPLHRDQRHVRVCGKASSPSLTTKFHSVCDGGFSRGAEYLLCAITRMEWGVCKEDYPSSVCPQPARKATPPLFVPSWYLYGCLEIVPFSFQMTLQQGIALSSSLHPSIPPASQRQIS